MSCSPDCPPDCSGKGVLEPTVVAGATSGLGEWLSAVLLLGGVLGLLMAFKGRGKRSNPKHNPGNPHNPMGEYKARQLPPKRFKHIRSIQLTEGVRALVGFKSGARKAPGKGHSEIQSLRFNPAVFTKAEARKWAREHDFKSVLESDK